MKPNTSTPHRKRQHGAILAFAGMALLTLVGMTVVGVDLGRLAFTATEVQTVAEVGATAYARSWLSGLGNGGDPGAGACEAQAMEAVSANGVDGQAATNANIESFERGYYTFGGTRPRFSTNVPAGKDANAVRANGVATVNNIFAALVGDPTSTVRKTAVATLTCGDRARTLPVAVGDCMFDAFTGPEDCSDLPGLTQQNVHIDDSCWTSLSTTDSANTSDLRDYIRTICGLGASTPPPPVSVGQDIRVSEGQHNSLCQTMQDCYDAGHVEFVVPVVDCAAAVACAAQHTGSLEVTGFAAIRLSSRPVCTANPKTWALESFCSSDPTDGVGGECDFGLYKVAMVE